MPTSDRARLWNPSRRAEAFEDAFNLTDQLGNVSARWAIPIPEQRADGCIDCGHPVTLASKGRCQA